MELVLSTPTIRSRSTPQPTLASHRGDRADDYVVDVPGARCTVELDGHELQEPLTLPCTLSVPFERDMNAMLAKRVTFRVLDAHGHELSTHALPLRECVPVLTKSAILWHDASVSTPDKQTPLSMDVAIGTAVAKQPRQLVGYYIKYKGSVQTLASMMSLHRNTVALGLLTPIAGCLVGVAVASPVLIPLALAVLVLGAPLWTVIVIALLLIAVVASIVAVAAVKLASSKRLQRQLGTFLRGPHGQLLLFRDASPDEAKIKTLVMTDTRCKLAASILIDAIGNASNAIPIVGKRVWAPCADSMLSAMYPPLAPKNKYLAYAMKWLPFTIPTATVSWFKENGRVQDLQHAPAVLAQLGTSFGALAGDAIAFGKTQLQAQSMKGE